MLDDAPAPPRARRRHRCDDLVAELRGRILDGRWAPGERLPTRRELEAELGVASVTLQRALDELCAHGFLSAAGRAGTSVNPRPPHLHRVLLVQPYRSVRPGGHWQALQRVAARYDGAAACSVEGFPHIDPGNANDPGYRRLADIVGAHSCAGIVFETNPQQLAGTPVLDEPGIPRIALMMDAFPAGISAVRYDAAGFVRHALDHLLERGCRRIALIAGRHPGSQAMDTLERSLAERTLTIPPYWRFCLDPFGAESARNLAHLLFRRDGGEMPDGLLIWDDTLAEAVLSGIVDAGGMPPQGLEVVAHANLPDDSPLPFPCRRLGYDLGFCLEECLRCFALHHAGEPVPPRIELPAIFADELPVPR